MGNKSSSLGKIIVFSVIFLLVGGIAGYFIGKNSSQPDFREFGGNPQMNMNDSVKSEIASFFEGTQDSEEISAYCEANPVYCMEYCRTINPDDMRCETLIGDFRGGMPAR